MAGKIVDFKPCLLLSGFGFQTETPANSRRSQASSATAPKAGDSKSNPLLTATLQKTSWDCIRITRRVNIYTWKMLKVLSRTLYLLYYFLSHLAAPSKSNLFRYMSFSFLLTQLLKSHFTLYEIERLIAAGGERFPV